MRKRKKRRTLVQLVPSISNWLMIKMERKLRGFKIGTLGTF